MPILLLFIAISCFSSSQAQSGLPYSEFLREAKRNAQWNPDYAFEMAKKAEDQGWEQDNKLLVIESNLLLGELFFEQSAYNHAHSHLIRCQKLLSEQHDARLLARTSNQLGNLYYFLGREEKVLPSHRQAVDLYNRLGDTLGMAETYGFIGHYYEKKQYYDSALAYQNRALSMLRERGNQSLTSRTLANIGSIHEDLEQYAKADSFFAESLELNDSLQQISERIALLNNLGDIAYKQQDYQKAESWMKRALQLAQITQNNYQIRSSLRDLSQLYAARKQHELAYAYLDSSVVFYKKIYSEDGLKQISRLEAFFETEQKEKEISLLEKDRRISQLVISLVLAGLLSSVVIGVMLYHRKQQDLKQKHELYATQEKYMNAQLENKDRSLTSYSLHLMEKNQLLQQLKDELKSISRHGADNPKRQLRSLSRDIDLNLSHEKDWESFRMAFEAVHPSFFRHLSRQHSGLTHAELRLAALMKMHLDSREIATILNISTDSLRVARYRLRKKLQLEKETKLTSYLHTL